MDGTEKTLVKKRGQITGPSWILIEILSALDDFGIDKVINATLAKY